MESYQMENNISLNVLIVEPQQTPRATVIGSGLEAMQKAVGGYIEAVYPYADPVAIVCNEDGKNIGLPLNRALRDADGEMYDILAGTFIVCGLGEENFASLSDNLMDKYKEKFAQPEAFVRLGRSIIAVPIEPKKASPKIATEIHKSTHNHDER